MIDVDTIDYVTLIPTLVPHRCGSDSDCGGVRGLPALHDRAGSDPYPRCPPALTGSRRGETGDGVG